MSVFVKDLSLTLPQFELVFFRTVITTLVFLPVLVSTKQTFFPKGKRLLIFRGLAGFGGVSCLFYGNAHLPLAVVALLNWCSLLFVILISYFFLNEKLRPTSLLWALVAAFGLALLVSPESFQRSTSILHAPLPLFAVGISLLGALFSSLAVTAVRAATARFGASLIIFYFSIISAIVAAPLAAAQWIWPHGTEWMELLAMGLLGSAAQFAMTQGYRHAPAGLVSTMGLMTAVFSSVLGWSIFGERLAWIQWIGMLTVGAGVAAATLSSKERASQVLPAQA